MSKRGQKKGLTSYGPLTTNKVKGVDQKQTEENGLADKQRKRVKKTGLKARPPLEKEKYPTASEIENFESAPREEKSDTSETEGTAYKTEKEKMERKNQLIMRLGIGLIMTVFFVTWIFTLKYEFKASLKKNSGNEFNWSQTKAELDKAMSQVKQAMAEIKKIQKPEPENLSKDQELTAEQINLLKDRLLEEVSTSTASSTVK